MKNKLKTININIIIFLLNFFIYQSAFSEIIKNFEIKGNFRVSNETVIMFSNLKIGDNVTKNDLNEALKNLYYTDYFKDVSISLEDGYLKIVLIENPIIQSVEIKGVKQNNINEKLRDITIKLEKYPFVENQINDQVSLIKNTLKSNGYYFVDLKTSVSINDNNTVDLIYDINLGEIAKIKKISFIGNKIFRDNTLRNVVISEESKFWKFLSNNKFLDKNRISADLARLNNFYKNRGYYNAKIKSTTGIITEDKQFELIFNINAGEKFFF